MDNERSKSRLQELNAKLSDLTEEKKKLMQDLSMRKEEEESNLIRFFKMTKGLTIQAYTASEFFLTKVQVYELVPGRYHGCVSV